MDICRLKNSELEPKHQKYKGRVVLRGDIVKEDDSGSDAVFTEQAHLRHTWQPPKWWISYQGFLDAQNKQLTQNQLTLKSKWKMLRNCWKFPNWNAQTFGFVYHDTNGLNHGPVWRPSRSSRAKSARSSFSRTVAGTAIREISVGARLWKSSTLGMLICKPWTRIIHVCECGWDKIGWKETKYWSDVERTYETRWFRRTNIIRWPRLLGVHTERMRNTQRYCDNHRTMFESRITAGTTENTKLGKTWHLCMVLRYGRSCKEVRGTILRVSQQNNSVTLQSLNFMSWWPPIQGRRIEIRGRIVKSMLSKCSQMPVHRSNW